MLRLIIKCFYTLVILITYLCLSGCVLLDLKDDLLLLDNSSTISGWLETDDSHIKPILIALYKPVEKNQFKLETYTVRYGAGEFEILASSGNYYLVAFEDVNEDFTWQDNEHIGWYGKPTLLKAKDGKNFTNLKLTLRSPGKAKKELPNLYAPSTPRTSLLDENTRTGIVTDLDDPRFSPEVGKLGMWQPFEFVQQKNHGIFFLETYDPNKIPILFVHGSFGTGDVWREMINHIDREKFQPWIIQYPSGMRLDFISRIASEELTKLQIRFKYEKLFVIAHSVGGLVARSMINHNLQENQNFNIEFFASISTPWLGHVGADLGVKNAPVIVPSWYDLVPNSPFLQSLTTEALPTNLSHHLFFSYRATTLINNRIIKSNSDGSVAISSQLPIYVQDRAETVLGFDEDHSSIIKSQELINRLNNILRKATTTERISNYN